jgi:hypothetical protein
MSWIRGSTLLETELAPASESTMKLEMQERMHAVEEDLMDLMDASKVEK